MRLAAQRMDSHARYWTLRLSERIDHAPLKGEIFDTADIGQTVKARIDAYRQERPGASRPPFYQVTATEI
jgi:hypothetical protein